MHLNNNKTKKRFVADDYDETRQKATPNETTLTRVKLQNDSFDVINYKLTNYFERGVNKCDLCSLFFLSDVWFVVLYSLLWFAVCDSNISYFLLYLYFT